MLILVNGLPGSGTTTLAVPLARRLGIPLVSEGYCRRPADELVRRYATRVLHPGHFDGHRLAGVRAAAAVRQAPLGIGPVLTLDP